MKSHTKENVSSVATNAFGLAYLVNICAGIPAYLVYVDKLPSDVLEVKTEPNSPLFAVYVALLVLVVFGPPLADRPTRSAGSADRPRLAHILVTAHPLLTVPHGQWDQLSVHDRPRLDAPMPWL